MAKHTFSFVYVFVSVCVRKVWNEYDPLSLYGPGKKQQPKTHSRIMLSANKGKKKKLRKDICNDTIINEILNSLTTFGFADP